MISLGPVQETLLVPLYGRADLTRRGSALIDDPKAVEMVESIDYDFTGFDDLGNSIGCSLRTRIHDLWVRRWLAEHPTGTVVELGAGLNTRFERLDNGRAHWVDLDLPDAIDLRRRFFTATDRRRMVAASVTDPDWLELVADLPGPWFFVAEAVLIYLDEAEVRSVFERLGARYAGSPLSFDTWGRWIRDNPDGHAILSRMEASVRWICDEPRRLSEWGTGLAVEEVRTLDEAPAELIELLPAEIQAKLPELAADPQASSYRQVLARL